MSRTHEYRRLRPNADWPSIVRSVLHDEGKAREAARAILWQEVQYFVQYIVKLPIGPLNEDGEARSDIALRVLQKLEAKDNAHLTEWLERQDRRRNHASFWGWVKTIAWSTSIDHARTSRMNIGRRGESFQWIRLDCVDPLLLGAALGSPHSYLGCAGDQELDDVLAELQRELLDDDPAVVALIEGTDATSGPGETERWR